MGELAQPIEKETPGGEYDPLEIDLEKEGEISTNTCNIKTEEINIKNETLSNFCEDSTNFDQKSSLAATDTDKKFKCEFCDYRARKPSIVKIHKNAVHSGIKHICVSCDSYFTNKGALTKHMKSVHEGSEQVTETICSTERRYICKYCKCPYTFEHSLKAHMKTKHPKEHIEEEEVSSESQLQCKICDYKAKTKKALIYHHDINHIVHQCKLCDHIAKSSVQLSDHHKSIHLGLKYICELCGQEFVNQNVFCSHKKKHLKTLLSYVMALIKQSNL